MFVNRLTINLILFCSVACGASTEMILTHDENDNRMPAWSSDGKWIAYVSLRNQKPHLVLRSSDGTGEEKILSDRVCRDTNIAWKPDSNRLAVTVRKSDMFNVCEIELASGQKRLFPGKSPQYSPDGKTLGLLRDDNLVLLDSATGQPIVGINTDSLKNVHSFTWAQDGKYIYVSHEGDLWRMTSDGNGKECLLDNANKAVFPSFLQWPKVLQSGDTVFFSVVTDGLYGDVSNNMVGRLDIAAKKIKVMSDAEQWAVSPCGRWLLCVVGTNISLYDMKDGRKIDLGTGVDPSFSPDGKKVAYSRSKELFAPGEIVIAELDKLIAAGTTDAPPTQK